MATAQFCIVRKKILYCKVQGRIVLQDWFSWLKSILQYRELYCRLEAGCGRTVLQYSPLCCNRLAWLRDIVSQYTWVYCDQGQGSWACWGAGQVLGRRWARAERAGWRAWACWGARACGRALGARVSGRRAGE